MFNKERNNVWKYFESTVEKYRDRWTCNCSPQFVNLLISSVVAKLTTVGAMVFYFAGREMSDEIMSEFNKMFLKLRVQWIILLIVVFSKFELVDANISHWRLYSWARHWSRIFIIRCWWNCISSVSRSKLQISRIFEFFISFSTDLRSLITNFIFVLQDIFSFCWKWHFSFLENIHWKNEKTWEQRLSDKNEHHWHQIGN